MSGVGGGKAKICQKFTTLIRTVTITVRLCNGRYRAFQRLVWMVGFDQQLKRQEVWTSTTFFPPPPQTNRRWFIYWENCRHLLGGWVGEGVTWLLIIPSRVGLLPAPNMHSSVEKIVQIFLDFEERRGDEAVLFLSILCILTPV